LKAVVAYNIWRGCGLKKHFIRVLGFEIDPNDGSAVGVSVLLVQSSVPLSL